MVEIGLVTFVIALMAVVFMDDIPNSVKKQLYIKKHPEIKIFLDTYKQLNERRESDCEAMGRLRCVMTCVSEKENQILNDAHFNFLKDSKKMERCMESFCETNKNVIRDAQKIFFDEFDCRVMRWAERARVQQKIEVKKQKSIAQAERRSLWKSKKLEK